VTFATPPASRRWTVGTAWCHTIRVVRDHGLRAAWFGILGEIGYRRVMLMERLLDGGIPEIPTPPMTTVALLGPGEVADYARLRPDLDATAVHRRLALGHQCFVVWHEGRIVHAGWAARDRATIEFLGTELRLAADEIYQYDSFTAPEFRGRNLAATRVTAMAREFSRAGYRRLIAAVVPENRVGFRPLEKAGYRLCGWVGVVTLLRWRWEFYRPRRPAP
jgi:L-amino acid N-acyltransferase YncA